LVVDLGYFDVGGRVFGCSWLSVSTIDIPLIALLVMLGFLLCNCHKAIFFCTCIYKIVSALSLRSQVLLARDDPDGG
jgi:hypothetical protein